MGIMNGKPRTAGESLSSCHAGFDSAVGLWLNATMHTHCVSGQGRITVGTSVRRLTGLDIFVVGHGGSMRYLRRIRQRWTYSLAPCTPLRISPYSAPSGPSQMLPSLSWKRYRPVSES